MNTKIFGILVVSVAVASAGIYFVNRKDNVPSEELTTEIEEPQVVSPELTDAQQSKPLSSGVKKSSTSTIVPTKSPTVSVPKTLTPTPAMPRAPHLITIKNFAFSPSSITVQKGDNVNWGNEDSAPHTVTFQDGGLSSWTLSTDESFNRNFNTVGTFTYHCNLHPSMTGTVIVTN